MTLRDFQLDKHFRVGGGISWKEQADEIFFWPVGQWGLLIQDGLYKLPFTHLVFKITNKYCNIIRRVCQTLSSGNKLDHI